MKKHKSKKFIDKKLAQKIGKEKKKIEVHSTTKTSRRNSFANMLYIFLICFICGVILMGMLLMEKKIDQSYAQLTQEKLKREATQKEEELWQRIVHKYPDYRDGYFHLALLAFTLGNTAEAQLYNEQALKIDPNFPNGRLFESRLFHAQK